MFKATRFYVSSGTGISSISPMNAFDAALLDAGAGDINLIKVSSVLPAGIEEVSEIPHKVGSFLPSVLSVSQGQGEKLAAGLAYGLRDDDTGGYVAEYTAKGEIGMVQEILLDRLKAMGEDRGTGLHGIKTVHSVIDVEPGAFGCSLAILVYLP